MELGNRIRALRTDRGITQEQLAQELQLLVGGGSDFHAIPDRYPTELGVWQVHYEDVKGVIEWK